MRFLLTAFLALFGIAANAADLAPYSCGAEEVHAFDVVGGAEAAVGYGFAGLSAETGVGIAAGVAVGLDGTDVAIAGYNAMANGVPQATLTSQGLQAVGVPQDWANGVDAGISVIGTMGVGAAARSSVLGGKTTAVSTYFPASDGIVGEKGTTYLYKGTLIDRYGGGLNSRYFSPVGTPAEMRALPQSSLGGDLRTFMVEKPFPVEQGTVAPAFGQIGLGVQYKAPVNLGVLMERGILREIR